MTPHQKQAMVKALQARGHTVAMTGDGVNDVLALKLADLGIAMGSGAAATKAVAELVLLDGRFATLPGVVAEGRRVTANIERVANLFVTKTVWATLLAVAAGVALLPYPFLPRHLTIIDTPGDRRPVVLPGARARTAAATCPGSSAGCCVSPSRPAAIVAAATFAAYALARADGLPLVAAAHRRDPGRAHAQPVRARAAGNPADLAQDRCWSAPRWPGSSLLFPVPAVRRFYALRLPQQPILAARCSSARPASSRSWHSG